jgi:uncharacterized protein with HEPN domain
MSSDETERAAQRVNDILASIAEIEGFLSGLGESAFLADRKCVLAVTHLIMIIGEAAKNLAPGVEARHPEIPWRDVRSMRDRIVHEYGTINPRLVWRIATNDLAPLRLAMMAERDFLTSC